MFSNNRHHEAPVYQRDALVIGQVIQGGSDYYRGYRNHYCRARLAGTSKWAEKPDPDTLLSSAATSCNWYDCGSGDAGDI
ncbi:hypothetical protein BMR07_02380 [Methylococcaceae bacterium CS1]|nr:hypothetical protein BMR07_02380 [Methylococcaceae bacterium CS1]